MFTLAFLFCGSAMQSQRYMTPNEVARLLNVARYRVYAWVRDEKIPYLRTVGRILFDSEEIEQWLRRDRKDSNDSESLKRPVIEVSAGT